MIETIKPTQQNITSAKQVKDENYCSIFPIFLSLRPNENKNIARFFNIFMTFRQEIKGANFETRKGRPYSSSFGYIPLLVECWLFSRSCDLKRINLFVDIWLFSWLRFTNLRQESNELFLDFLPFTPIWDQKGRKLFRDFWPFFRIWDQKAMNLLHDFSLFSQNNDRNGLNLFLNFCYFRKSHTRKETTYYSLFWPFSGI